MTSDLEKKPTPILLTEECDGIFLLTLNRPEAMNALSGALALQVKETLASLAERRDVRVVIIAGAGDRAFCAGADLKERRDGDPDAKWAQRTLLWELNRTIYQLPQPAIAAVHGWCLGGGFELALYCDMRVASEDAVFSFPEMSLGAFPGAGAAILLPRLISRARAKEIFFTARRVNAREAFDLGLVEWVVPKEQVVKKAFEIAEQIKRNSSPGGAAGIKRMVNIGTDLGFEGAIALNEALRRPLEASQDYAEGIQAFFEKRAPRFRGC
jgi:enoyl-CoA hydratase/carnithine racemase